jgi:hypothetical protein
MASIYTGCVWKCEEWKKGLTECSNQNAYFWGFCLKGLGLEGPIEVLGADWKIVLFGKWLKLRIVEGKQTDGGVWVNLYLVLRSGMDSMGEGGGSLE